MKPMNLTGQVISGLEVLRRVENTKQGNTRWECKCVLCGKTKSVSGRNLVKQKTYGCGCDRVNKLIERNTRHGMSGTRIYKEYKNMQTRCTNKNRKEYESYGGRGISVCAEWSGENGFERFMRWSFDNGYDDGLSLDRIDVNGGYSPDNCRWITMKEQASNKRNSIRVTYRGETKTLKEWCELLSLNYNTLYSRLRSGWDIEKMFEQKLLNQDTYKEKCAEIGLSYNTFLWRKNKAKMPIEECLKT